MRRQGFAAAGLVAAAFALAGCGGGAPGEVPGASATARINNIIAFNSFNAPPGPVAADPNALRIICPDIEVLDGTAALRFYSGGNASGSVRHQYSLGDVARECNVSGNQIALRVGVEGRVLLGPTGAPGSFSVPVRIAVRRDKDNSVIASKAFRANVSVPSGETQAVFQIVSDPILVPLTREDASQDYTIVVGLDGAAPREPAPPRRRRGG